MSAFPTNSGPTPTSGAFCFQMCLSRYSESLGYVVTIIRAGWPLKFHWGEAETTATRTLQILWI